MSDFNTQKLHDEIAKELFLDAVHVGNEPKQSAVLALINAEVFMTARAAYLQSKADVVQYKVDLTAPDLLTKGCGQCHGAGKFRPHNMSKNKPAPDCKMCNGSGRVVVTP